MESKQINNSPFVNTKFLELVKSLSEQKDFATFKKGYVVKDGVLYNIGNRDYVDYRPSLKISQRTLEKRKISNIQLDSLTYDQVREHLKDKEYFWVLC